MGVVLDGPPVLTPRRATVFHESWVGCGEAIHQVFGTGSTKISEPVDLQRQPGRTSFAGTIKPGHRARNASA